MGVSTLGLSTADWPFVLPSAVFTLCPLATLLFPARAAIGNAVTAVIIRTACALPPKAAAVLADQRVCFGPQADGLGKWQLLSDGAN
jgi:hypothetical protein